MPTITFQKLFLIACIAALGATLATVARAETAAFSGKTFHRIVSPKPVLPMCPMAPAMTPIDTHGSDHARQTPIPGGVLGARHPQIAAQLAQIPRCVNSHIRFNQG